MRSVKEGEVKECQTYLSPRCNNTTMSEETIASQNPLKFSELGELLLSLGESSDIAYVNKLMERCSLNLSTLTKLGEDPSDILAAIKGVILSDTHYEGFDYEELQTLLDNIMNLCPFETIVAIYTVDDVVQALNSRIPHLVRTACKVISRVQPLDYLLTIEQKYGVMSIFVDVYFDATTDLTVINEMESVFRVVSANLEVRNFILNDKEELLLKVKTNGESLILSRLLELLTIEINEMKGIHELNEQVFIFSDKEILDMIEKDYFDFINLLRYIISVFENINSRGKELTLIESGNDDLSKLLLDKVSYVVPVIGDIWQRNVSDVTLLARSYFFRFFELVSYLPDYNYFKQLDQAYLTIDYDNPDVIDFLSFVNPLYLAQYCSELVSNYVKVVPSHLTILRNLISTPDSFLLIKQKCTSSSILALPYFEQMVLLEKMSQFEYSVKFLVSYLPEVMNNLINDGDVNNIVEPETVELRSSVVRNMLRFPETDLLQWYIPLTNELYKINNPGKTTVPGTKIEQVFL